MKPDKETQDKISQLQLIEQNIQNFLLQKQTFQNKLFEIENAISELGSAKEPIYKIVGSIMVGSNKTEVKKDLESKKEILDIRIKNLEKQEDKLKEKANEIQSEVMKELKK